MQNECQSNHQGKWALVGQNRVSSVAFATKDNGDGKQYCNNSLTQQGIVLQPQMHVHTRPITSPVPLPLSPARRDYVPDRLPMHVEGKMVQECGVECSGQKNVFRPAVENVITGKGVSLSCFEQDPLALDEVNVFLSSLGEPATTSVSQQPPVSLCPSTRVRSTSLREGRTSIAASADDEGGDAPVHEHSLVTMYDNAAVAADVPAGRVPDQVADHGFGHLSETVGRTTPPSRDLGMECQSGSVTQHDAEGVYGATDVTLSLQKLLLKTKTKVEDRRPLGEAISGESSDDLSQRINVALAEYPQPVSFTPEQLSQNIAQRLDDAERRELEQFRALFGQLTLGLSTGSPETDPASDPMTDIENLVPFGHAACVEPAEARAPPVIPRLDLSNIDPGMDVSLLAHDTAPEEPVQNLKYNLTYPAGNGLPYPRGSDPARGVWVSPEPSVPSVVYVQSRGRYEPVRGARWVTLDNDDAPPPSARGERPGTVQQSSGPIPPAPRVPPAVVPSRPKVTFQEPLDIFQPVQAPVPVAETAGSPGARMPSLVPKEVKLDKPLTFNGNKRHLQNFIFVMRQYIDSVGLGNGGQACRFLVSFLRDDALTWWRSFSRDSLQVFDQLTVEELFDALEAHFSDIDREMKLRTKLFGMKQTGSVQQFTTAFEQVQLELGTHRVDDDVAMHLYIMALKPMTQQWVMLQRPENLQDAIVLAERADQTLSWQRRGVQSQYHSGYRSQGFRPQQRGGPIGHKNVSQYSNSRYKGPAPMVLGNVGNSAADKVCHHCGKPGHVKKDCWKLNGVPEHVRNKQNGGRKPGNQLPPPPPKSKN